MIEKKWLCREFDTSVILVEYELVWNDKIHRWEFPSGDFVKFVEWEVFDKPIDAICHRIESIKSVINYYTIELKESDSENEDMREAWGELIRNYSLALESAMKLQERHL